MSTEQKEAILQCYNRCCGQSFDPSKNGPDSCIHHPGVPVFHDAYKGWSCCNKKTTDFTEFLNIKGCTTSYHTNVKPPEIQKPQKEVENECDKIEVSTITPLPLPLKKVSISRPSPNCPMKKLRSNVGASLKPLLDKMETIKLYEKVAENPTSVPINTTCKHGGCKQVYKGEESDLETCVYHPGVPVFHEGLKFWTCCLKRTTDFDSFLEQVGCTTGDHLWFKQQSEEEKRAPCRFDWHQTGSSVVLAVYSKCPIPDSCRIIANPVKLCLHIVFGEERKLFDQEFLLYGVIDVDRSSVSYLGSKVEITLKKAEAANWKELFIVNECINVSEETNGIEEEPGLDITQRLQNK